MANYYKELDEKLGELQKKRELLEKIINGEYNFIFDVDFAKMKENVGNGKVSEDLNTGIIDLPLIIRDAEIVLSLIDYLETIVYQKQRILSDIESKKHTMSYNPDDLYYEDSRYKFTYKQVLEMMDFAKKVLDDGILYRILDFHLKTSNLIHELREKEDNIKLSSRHQDVHDIINSDDDEFGIIIIHETKDGFKQKDRVVVGTKKDIMLSNALGVPFPKDEDQDSYWIGPHGGDIYVPSHKLTKEFHTTNLTSNHLKMIEMEKKKRKMLRLKNSKDELGYIPGLIISKKELLDNGFNIESLGWKPLKTKQKRKSLFKLYKEKYPFHSKLLYLKWDIEDNIKINKAKKKF